MIASISNSNDFPAIDVAKAEVDDAGSPVQIIAVEQEPEGADPAPAF
jgi:hypothetical protein